MKLCPECNKNQIEDKYSMCMSCLKDTKKANQGIDIGIGIDKLKQINWNLGTIALTLKMRLLSDLENNDNKTPMQKRIHQMLLKKADKDLENFEKIKKEEQNE